MSERSNRGTAVEQRPLETWRRRVGALTALPALIAKLGTDPPDVVAAASLPVDALANADNRIPFDAFGRLLQIAADMTRHDHFALTVGRMVRLDDLGVIGDLDRNATTLAEALQFMVVYQHLNSEYAGASPFTRSFRRWTGSSPGDFRKLSQAREPHHDSPRVSAKMLLARGEPDADPAATRET